jgi:hypothetical protein
MKHSATFWILEFQDLTAVVTKSTQRVPSSGIYPRVPEFCLPPAFKLVPCWDVSSTLKLEAICSSETSVDFQWMQAGVVKHQTFRNILDIRISGSHSGGYKE